MGSKATHHLRGGQLHPVAQPAVAPLVDPVGKNPIVGEPQGPGFASDFDKNMALHRVDAIHDRVAMQDKGAMEGIRQRAHIAELKAKNEARRAQRSK